MGYSPSATGVNSYRAPCRWTARRPFLFGSSSTAVFSVPDPVGAVIRTQLSNLNTFLTMQLCVNIPPVAVGRARCRGGGYLPSCWRRRGGRHGGNCHDLSAFVEPRAEQRVSWRYRRKDPARLAPVRAGRDGRFSTCCRGRLRSRPTTSFLGPSPGDAVLARWLRRARRGGRSFRIERASSPSTVGFGLVSSPGCLRLHPFVRFLYF